MLYYEGKDVSIKYLELVKYGELFVFLQFPLFL